MPQPTPLLVLLPRVVHRELVAMPCACGFTIVADPNDPEPGVRKHQARLGHRMWRKRMEL